ncbi:MAG: DHHA1 domain-containing protein, partial [Planctomycetota bacterium]|nr:DHHA1 domain-containing protein [Planctomycetota bacterium]
VGPDRLRFDFSHPRAMTPDEIDRVEALVNEHVVANATVGTTVEKLAEAKARGVVALFGEKYDEEVRVVDVPGFSTELCGGTHVRAAGDIGSFVIVSEGAIQAGVRRLEALTGTGALEWIQRQRRLLQETARRLKTAPEELPGRVDALQKLAKEARKQKTRSSQADVAGALERVRDQLEEVEGVLMGFVTLELDLKGLRDLATRVRSLSKDLAVVLLGSDGDKVPWIAICAGAARERVESGSIVTFLKDHLGGGGGGKPELAQGQGQDAQGIEAAKEQIQDHLNSALRG